MRNSWKDNNRNSSNIQANGTNIFVEEPEVFEIPKPMRRRRAPTPQDSPILKEISFRPGEKEPSPPPRPPKGQRPIGTEKRKWTSDKKEKDDAKSHASTLSSSDDAMADLASTSSGSTDDTSSAEKSSLDPATDESTV